MAEHASDRRRLVRAAMNAPYLEREEEHDLAVRWREQGDEAALHRLTAAHMRLVIAMAAKFRRYGLSNADLIQEGHIGLLEAASRFEPEREVRFSTYAAWWIRAAIQDYVLRNWSIVRGGTSSTQKALFFNLRRIRARLAQQMGNIGEAAIDREVAATLGVSVGDVAAMGARLSGPDASLNAPLYDRDEASGERQDALVADQIDVDEAVGATIDGERRLRWLDEALTVLDERELKIVRERRLAGDGETLETIGRRLGISKERVRQIEARALEKLRSALLARQPDRAAFV
ncbi:RNA polymerase factor sigma-32 [Pinisolibacter aquiterrae]|uniref:RNA polymerase factor sigma-32 n=1 Tax=Pinisolibacter aquiterrae TaxID=2815579 RepID=UPI001C3D8C6E|nr:RNA polymerase factor sigma-32 [Pinisolibacter aquiterrae]MBV5266182.1 RNA polymerase factor sigma-32 [Pinisolibacter aquiterrae]MCC8236270.1 RNA polymerase factor sigma-32 [Pinisolibacter aquiterrae]